MHLTEVQSSFTDHMFSPVEVVENPSEEFSNLFNVGDIPLEQRLKIYRNHIVTTLSESLVMNFPLVEKLTGKGFLLTAAKLYLFDNPPKQACLDCYGEEFPDFLEDYDHARSLPYLSDVARLDWSMNEVRTAKVDPTLQVEDLVSVPENKYDTAVFKLKKSVRLIQSNFPINSIAHFCLQEEADSTLNVAPKDTFLLVVRHLWEAEIFALSQSEYGFFNLLNEGKNLSKALEVVMKKDAGFDLSQFLQKYISHETFSEVVTK